MSDSTIPKSTPLPALFLHIYWIFFTHIVAIMAAILIMSNHLQSRVSPNIAFFLVPLSAMIARYLDIRFYKGQTAEGASATMGHWRKYSVRVVAAHAALWVGVQIITRLGWY
jgi:hypothetical protein